MTLKETMLLLVIVGVSTGVGCSEGSPMQLNSEGELSLTVNSADPFNRGSAIGTLDDNGSWRYAWDHTRVRYELRINDESRQLTDVNCGRRPAPAPRCGGISGGSGFAQLFVHIYYMQERSADVEKTVIVAAWGNRETFEAVVLPESAESREIFDQASGLDTGDVAGLIQGLAQEAEEVIRGETLRIEF